MISIVDFFYVYTFIIITGCLWLCKRAQKATVLTVTLTSRRKQNSTLDLCGAVERSPECLNRFWSVSAAPAASFALWFLLLYQWGQNMA